MADDAELPAEWAAAVTMFGVRDVGTVWLAFRAHHVAKGDVNSERGWRALFVDSWARRERNYQAKAVASTGRRPRVVQEDTGARAWAPPTAEDFEPTGTGGKR